jgi:hypothetical protein
MSGQPGLEAVTSAEAELPEGPGIPSICVFKNRPPCPGSVGNSPFFTPHRDSGGAALSLERAGRPIIPILRAGCRPPDPSRNAVQPDARLALRLTQHK